MWPIVCMLNVMAYVNLRMPTLKHYNLLAYAMYCCGFRCTLVSCPTFQTGTSQGQVKRSIVTRPIFAGGVSGSGA